MSAISGSSMTAAAVASQVKNSRKLQKAIKICGRRLGLWGELGCRESVCWANHQNIMLGSYGVCASKREEGFHAFKKEAPLTLSDGDAGEESFHAFKKEYSPLTLSGGDAGEEGFHAFKKVVPLAVSDGAAGLEATLNSLSKWIVSAASAVMILWRHDAVALWAAVGAVLNTVLSLILKRILNQERPVSTLRSDPGMPSSHAQTFFYIITFLNLSLVEWYGKNAFTTILSGIFVIVASYFSWLRFSQQLHTLGQVVVGGIVGSIFSFLWFWSWYTLVSDLFVSLLWVRIVVTLGAIVCGLSYLHYIINNSGIADQK